MFLSHVSEHYFSKSPFYSRNKMITTLLDEFERKAGKKPALHELLGCMIVNTGAVHELLEIVAKKSKDYYRDVIIQLMKWWNIFQH